MQAPTESSINRINRLDNRLANQIAAGEVVERPASVVKELLENSIDANTTRIEVDIERGGTRLIRVTDNGCGIVKDDLNLALCRHATSKIATTEDLAAIGSLGFRGEALASIASVSRLTLTSRTQESDFAWQAMAEGRDMAIDIQPASATVGTRIEVRDLFYNTPARQKFLRAEKTEFSHVEEIFKRHALSNPTTAFILKHNGRVIKRIPAASDSQPYLERIEAICGKPFAQNAISFSCSHDIVKIHGWVGGYHFHRSESDLQYVFVNNRPVKDKMLNHAIRQSYQGLLPPGRMPTYVIFLQVDPAKIDVNVHPTKHEVRFEEQRTIHDLLVKSIGEALSENGLSEALGEISTSESRSNSPIIPTAAYSPHSRSGNFSSVSESRGNYTYQQASPSFSNIQPNETLSRFSYFKLESGYWIFFAQQDAFIVDEQAFLFECLSRLIKGKLKSSSKPLLFPQVIELDTIDLEEFNTVDLLQSLGFVFTPNTDASILLQQLPYWMDSVEANQVANGFPQLIKAFIAGLKSDELTNNFDPTISTAQYQLAFNQIYHLLKPLSQGVVDYFIQQAPELINSKKLALMKL